MQKSLSLLLLLTLTGGPVLSQTSAESEPTVELGIQQVRNGDFQTASLTLDAVIRKLAVEPVLHSKELAQAYLYRGVAFVGLGQEQEAKGAFAAALQYDRSLRIGEDKFPPRVVRVFEAARTGKTKSVLLPPSGATKKAGLGAGAILAIVGGVLAAGGAAAAAAGGSSTTAPSGQLGSFAAPGAQVDDITLVSLNPPPASTLHVGQTVSVSFLVNKQGPDPGIVKMVLRHTSGGISCGPQDKFTNTPLFNPGTQIPFTIAMRITGFYGDAGCPTFPLLLDTLTLVLDKNALEAENILFSKSWPVGYTVVQ